MKNTVKILSATLLLFLGLGLSNLHAQDNWTPVQKEVWKNINDYFDAFARGDAKAYLSYVHPDFEGWDTHQLLPRKKIDIELMLSSFFPGNKVLKYTLKPLTVKVYGEVAFAHYLYDVVVEGADGKRKSEEGRYTDILLKQGDKWLVIGDQGGSTK
jgi:ketosteroid isomerase-like protein